MHELSIVISIVELAERVAKENQASRIETIELEIGQLSGVVPESLEFAWQEGVRNTMLEHASRVVHNIPAKGHCNDCNTTFPVAALFDPCPFCGGYFVQVTEGKELRIKAISVS